MPARHRARKRSVAPKLPAELALYRVDSARHRLPAVFGRGDLTRLGLGVMIGAGVFQVAGIQAATNAGPAVIVSFVLAGLGCLLAALSYAELSSAIPVAGSAYTFSYVIFGEIWAWLVGWALVLELVLAAAVVGRAWSEYLLATLRSFGLPVPSGVAAVAGFDSAVNVGAVLLILLITVLLATGTKLSARVIRVVVAAKVAVILAVVLVGLFLLDLANYTPFIPEPQPVSSSGATATVLQLLTHQVGNRFGIFGVFAAAGVITFSFIGFDLIATAAEETERPRRSVPSGILRSVVLVTVLYVAMAVVMVGMRPYPELDSGAPLADVFLAAGLGWAARFVTVGALLALTTVVMVVLVAQSRLLFAMSRDGMLPRGLCRVSLTYSAPAPAVVAAGTAGVLVSLYPQVGALQETLVLGALFGFLACTVGLLVARVTQPELERGFRVPGAPVVPLLAVGAIGWLMLNLQLSTWRNFGVWMLAGVLVYLAYGLRRSRLRRGEVRVPTSR